MLTLDTLTRQQRSAILFECISGSRAYGTSNIESDVDVRGVFAQPAAEPQELEGTSRNLLRGPIAALRGARNTDVPPCTLRFLRSVRLALAPLEGIAAMAAPTTA